MQNTTAERYTIIDNGDGTHSVRDNVAHQWLTRRGEEDMLPHQARSLWTEYVMDGS